MATKYHQQIRERAEIPPMITVANVAFTDEQQTRIYVDFGLPVEVVMGLVRLWVYNRSQVGYGVPTLDMECVLAEPDATRRVWQLTFSPLPEAQGINYPQRVIDEQALLEVVRNLGCAQLAFEPGAVTSRGSDVLLFSTVRPFGANGPRAQMVPVQPE